jgi:hypothetical protein
VSALGAIPPRDPQRDAVRRRERRRDRRDGYLGVALTGTVFMLALVGGGWAGSAFDAGSGEPMLWCAVGMAFAQGAAFGVANAWRGLAALVATLFAVPRLFRRIQPGDPSPSEAGVRETRIERGVETVAVRVHTAVFLVLALLLGVLAAWASPLAQFGQVWWRFALPPLLLAPFIRRVYSVMWPH